MSTKTHTPAVADDAAGYVDLVRHLSGFVNVRDGFRVFDAGEYIDDYKERLERYVLPARWSVRRCISGTLEIYNPLGEYCEIVQHPCGRPQLISDDRVAPVLKRAD